MRVQRHRRRSWVSVPMSKSGISCKGNRQPSSGAMISTSMAILNIVRKGRFDNARKLARMFLLGEQDPSGCRGTVRSRDTHLT